MTVPHLVQYQGSKRNIAQQIHKHFPRDINRVIEPFCGTAAVSLYSATKGFANKFVLNDINQPLIQLIEQCVENPLAVANDYENIWNKQFIYPQGPIEYFFHIRSQFNKSQNPSQLLFLLARIVKGSVRYNQNGELNQSCDKRRHGTKPATMAKNIHNISVALQGKTIFTSQDYTQTIMSAKNDDLVYMDPPYQGTSMAKDDRYIQTLNLDKFVSALEDLNQRDISYIVSFDGKTGTKSYGKPLPSHLNLQHLFIDAGVSSQATLVGRKSRTVESLYLSQALIERLEHTKRASTATLDLTYS